MPFCVQCGTKMDDAARFCSSCGAALYGAAPLSGNADDSLKCSNCGGLVPSMTVTCPYCGYEVNNLKASGGIQAFFEKLDAHDQQVFERNASKEAGGSIGGVLTAVLGLDTLVKMYSGLNAGDKRKLEMIQNFPVPNTKEDILEFIILASSRIKAKPRLLGNYNWMTEKKETDAFNHAWTAKIKQVYIKAQIIFKSDSEFLQKIEKIVNDSNVKI